MNNSDREVTTLIEDNLPVHHNAGATTESAALPVSTSAYTESALLQVQHRLLSLSTQVEQLQTHLAALASETQISGSQVSILVRHLTDTQATQAVDARLAELATQLATQEEHFAALQQRMTRFASADQLTQMMQLLTRTANQEQVERLLETTANVANREQVEGLTQLVGQAASQEQLERLLQGMAERSQLMGLEENLKKLSRTQFKANTLGESKEQQITQALATLQEIATRREQLQQSQTTLSNQQLSNARREGRSQMTAELLPALDSLDLAVEKGRTLLDLQQKQIEALVDAQANYETALEDIRAQWQRVHEEQTRHLALPTPGFWQRLLGNPPPLPEVAASKATEITFPTPPIALVKNSLQVFHDTTRAWVRGLELVRDRFVALLATENIQPIDALHQLFDPRLHVAVETAAQRDVPPNTVIQVLRKGYRQHDHILRYAEVVVARASE